MFGGGNSVKMNLIHCSFLGTDYSEECQLITTADHNSKPEHDQKKAEMARLSRIFGRKKRGLQLQKKGRLAREATKRVRLDAACTQENEEQIQDNFDSLNNTEKTSPTGVAISQLYINKRRRMATCEQLEKITKETSDRNVTLHDLRKALVVVNRLENYGLL